MSGFPGLQVVVVVVGGVAFSIWRWRQEVISNRGVVVFPWLFVVIIREVDGSHGFEGCEGMLGGVLCLLVWTWLLHS